MLASEFTISDMLAKKERLVVATLGRHCATPSLSCGEDSILADGKNCGYNSLKNAQINLALACTNPWFEH